MNKYNKVVTDEFNSECSFKLPLAFWAKLGRVVQYVYQTGQMLEDIKYDCTFMETSTDVDNLTVKFTMRNNINVNYSMTMSVGYIITTNFCDVAVMIHEVCSKMRKNKDPVESKKDKSIVDQLLK